MRGSIRSWPNSARSSLVGDRFDVEVPDDRYTFSHDQRCPLLHEEAFVIRRRQPGRFGGGRPALSIGNPDHEGGQPGGRRPRRNVGRGRIVMIFGRGRWAREPTPLLGVQPDDVPLERECFCSRIWLVSRIPISTTVGGSLGDAGS